MRQTLKQKQVKHYLAIFFLLIINTNIFADSKALDLFFSNTHSLSANFIQEIADRNGKTIEQSEGYLLIKRPNMFSLTYTKPDQQQYISNGKTLWVYDEELEQVTITPVDEKLLNSPMLLLTRNQNIRDLYHVKETVDYDKPENDIFILSTKNKEDKFDKVFNNIYLTFHKLQLIEIKMNDNFEQTTRLTLYNQNKNIKLDNKKFSFIIPFNVDVIGTQPN